MMLEITPGRVRVVRPGIATDHVEEAYDILSVCDEGEDVVVVVASLRGDGDILALPIGDGCHGELICSQSPGVVTGVGDCVPPGDGVYHSSTQDVIYVFSSKAIATLAKVMGALSQALP
jgi:hypothetical protein